MTLPVPHEHSTDEMQELLEALDTPVGQTSLIIHMRLVHDWDLRLTGVHSIEQVEAMLELHDEDHGGEVL